MQRIRALNDIDEEKQLGNIGQLMQTEALLSFVLLQLFQLPVTRTEFRIYFAFS